MIKTSVKRLPKLLFRNSACAMSKRSSKKKVEEIQVTTASEVGPVSRTTKGDILIKVHAKPGSKFNCITGVEAEGISIQIAAPPVDGEANATLVKYVSSVLGVRKSDVTLEKGSKSRCKIVNVSTVSLSVDEVMTKLRKAMEESN